MKKKLQEILKAILAIGCIAVVVGLTIIYTAQKTGAIGGMFENNVRGVGCTTATSTTANSLAANAIATNTLKFMTPGTGTTTIECDTRNADTIELSLFMLASSTLTDLRARLEFSNSTTTDDAIWFPQSFVRNQTSATNTPTMLISQNSLEYRFPFASTTSHRIGTSSLMNATFQQNDTNAYRLKLSDISAQFTRIIFYIPTGSTAYVPAHGTTALGDEPTATSTNAGIYAHVIRKEPIR